MRNVKLLALIGVMMLALASCKKDSDTDSSSKFTIVGKWNVDLFSEVETVQGVLLDSFEYEDYGSVEFDKDGTGSFEKLEDFT